MVKAKTGLNVIRRTDPARRWDVEVILNVVHDDDPLMDQFKYFSVNILQTALSIINLGSKARNNN